MNSNDAVQHICFELVWLLCLCGYYANSKSHRKLLLLRPRIMQVFGSWCNAFYASASQSGQNRMLYSSMICIMRGSVGPRCKAAFPNIVHHAPSSTSLAIFYKCSESSHHRRESISNGSVSCQSLFVLFTSELQKQSPAANMSKE